MFNFFKSKQEKQLLRLERLQDAQRLILDEIKSLTIQCFGGCNSIKCALVIHPKDPVQQQPKRKASKPKTKKGGEL